MPARPESVKVRQVKSLSPAANALPTVKIVKHSARNSRGPDPPEAQTRRIKHETDKSTSAGSSATLLANSVPHHTDSLNQEEEQKFDLLRYGSV